MKRQTQRTLEELAARRPGPPIVAMLIAILAVAAVVIWAAVRTDMVDNYMRRTPNAQEHSIYWAARRLSICYSVVAAGSVLGVVLVLQVFSVWRHSTERALLLHLACRKADENQDDT